MSSFRNAHQQYFTYLIHSQDNLGTSPVKEFSALKNLPAMQVQPLGQEDPLEKGTATHSSVLAWRISWTEEPGELQSIRPQRVRHN